MAIERSRLSRWVATAVLVAGLFMVVAPAQSRQPAGAAPGVPQFEVDPGWPKPPADWSWGQVIGIFADTQGHVWTSSRNRIAEWAPDGTLIQVLGRARPER